MKSTAERYCLLALACGVGGFLLLAWPQSARATLSAPQPSTAETGADEDSELGEYDIAELQRIQVTSVGKNPETMSEAPAPIFVITQEDIRRAGTQSIPETLRMAPGVDVARIDAGRYAISVRGFNDRFSNKLLVLEDNRAIYTPAFGGIFWEKQDTVMEDIDRIEVIRGPGGALWGANAFNGIINIITRDSKQTQGWLVSGGAGNQERAFGAIRYGGALTDTVYYRAYAKALNRDDIGGSDHSSGLQSGLAGFRLDGESADADRWMIEGKVYRSQSGETVRIPVQTPPTFAQISNDQVTFGGGFVLGKYSHSLGQDGEAIFQAFFNHTSVAFDTKGEREAENTGDFDFQHRFHLGRRQHLVWGFGYRVVGDHSRGSYSIRFVPESRTVTVLNLFVQDEISLAPSLVLRFGTKLEHNDYTGYEFQPNARLRWTPAPQHTAWIAISRAVRTPSRVENDGRVAVTTLPGPIVLRQLGSPDVLSEKLIAYEAGYRLQPRKWFALDLATFYRQYDDLNSNEFNPINTSVTPPELPLVIGSKLHGDSYGGEAAIQVKATDWWSLQPAYSVLFVDLRTDPDSRDTVSVANITGNSPRNQISLRSRMDLPHDWELDGWYRYVDALYHPKVPSYSTVDARIGWNPIPSTELSLVGQNLIEPSHPEFATRIRGLAELTEVKRSIFGKVVWHW